MRSGGIGTEVKTLKVFEKRAFPLLQVLVLAVLAQLACSSSQPAPESPLPGRSLNVVLITVDTLRADHLGCYGYPDIATPNIDRLASQGIRFSQAVSQVPLTLPSHWSILSGTYPTFHGVRDNTFYSVPQDVVTIPQVLQSEGYRTAAFIGAFILDRRFGLARGFDHYSDRFVPQKYQGAGAADVQRRGDEVVREFEEWLGENSQAKFFSWLHLFDPHDPYDPPEPFKSRYPRSPYDGEIAFVDKLIGKILHLLEKESLDDDTVVIFTSDHGESLGEHGEQTHGLFLYDSVIRIPLIIRIPGADFRPTVVDQLVRSIDIVPTILQILDMPAPPSVQGVGLISLARGRTRTLTSYSETFYPRNQLGWSELRAVQTDEHKYIQAPQPELYNLKQDPGELHNLYEVNRSRAHQMQETLSATASKYSRSQVPEEKSKVPDPETLEKLRSLGYLASRADRKPLEYAGDLPDPKANISIYQKLQEALQASSNGRSERAIRLLEEVLEQDANNHAARLTLGLEYQKERQHSQAAAQFRKILERDSEHVLAAFNLALSYFHTGKLDDASLGFQRVLELDPSYSKAHTNLGIIFHQQGKLEEAASQYSAAIQIDANDFVALNNLAVIDAHQGRIEEALKRARTALEIDPNNSGTYNTLGSIYYLQKNQEAAVDAYRLAVEIDPGNLESHLNLASIYFQMERFEEAVQTYRIALKLDPGNERAVAGLARAHSRIDNR